MKKKILFAGGAVILVAVLAIIVFLLPRNSEQNMVNMNLYFINENSSTILPESRKIAYDTAYDIPRLVLETLKKGPTDKNHKPVIANDVDILSVSVENGAVTCDLSRNFLGEDQNQTILSVYAIVKSLCQIDGVKTAKVLSGGQAIIAPDGNLVDYLSDRDINLEDDVESPEAKDVVLYFASKGKKMLVKEQRTIRITDKQPIEQYIINELIKGPTNKDTGAVLTSDTTLVSAETTDGTCFVNFKSNFVDRNTGSEDKEILAIYSIVNALTELDGVKNVQFLVEGKKVENFGFISIQNVLFRSDSLIEK